MIPKIIHQIWFQGWDKLPDKYKENVQSVITLNPDWKHIKWDENSIRNVLVSLGDEYVKKYDSLKLLHQKIDFSRYAILYTYGGISIDTDVLALKSLNDIPFINERDFIVSYSFNNWSINNATILVSEKNPLMKVFLDEIAPSCEPYANDFFCIYNTTGPMAFRKFVNEHRGEITVLDNSYLESCSYYDKYCTISPKAILNHKHEGTWISPEFRKIYTIYFWVRKYKIVLFISIVVLILILLFLRK